MSDDKQPGTPSQRETLLAGITAAGRALSTAVVMDHEAISRHLGLSMTEEKALELLDRLGPLTPGELAIQAGLAANTATYLIQRLQAKGFVRRTAHPNDGRKLLIELDQQRMAEIAHFYSGWDQSLTKLCAPYTDAELGTILQFLHDATRLQQQITATHRHADPPADPD
jgi:DNA-binding MarR family transcriptional regulator